MEVVMPRWLLAVVAVIVTGLGAAALWVSLAPRHSQCPGALAGAGEFELGGGFEMTDETGARVTQADVLDGPSLIYFGYTFCPDFCPNDAAMMAAAVDMLAERGLKVRPVFVSIDPDRDSPEVLAEWTDFFHPDMIGLTGSAEDVAKIAQTFRVYYAKPPSQQGEVDYLMDHSTLTYLVDQGGVVKAFFRNGDAPRQVADSVACHIAEGI
jgi:protein SCO1/2